MNTICLATSQTSLEGVNTYDELFLWSSSGQSSFDTNIGPNLDELGLVDPLNVDFVRVAVGVVAADRSVPRQGQGSDWNARKFEVTVEVGEPEKWAAVAEQLSRVINFLSGDRWTFQFVSIPSDTSTNVALDLGEGSDLARTVLLSGGADSAAGAMVSALSLEDGEEHALVSQYSAPAISPIQKAIVTYLGEFLPGRRRQHKQVRFIRRNNRLDGSPLKSEHSSRSRSLLFIALGLAVASNRSVPLWMPENGFASLNPPLGADRRGSLSTRTTHPKFLEDLGEVLRQVGAHGEIHNPFMRMTKGEMFRAVADAMGDDEASRYLSQTNSCAHTDGRYVGAPPGSSCGVCFGCLVRRASFAAAGLVDRTEYLSEDKTEKYGGFVAQKSIVEPMRDFVDRGITGRTIMAMPLPVSYDAMEALDLCRRGVAELGSFLE